MKPIKVDDSTASAVEAALASANGKKTAHVITTFQEVADLADEAEGRLDVLGVPKGKRRGAVFEAVSGDRVANAYSYTRRATRVLLVRRTAAWYLVKVEGADIYQNGGRERLHLTPEQDAAVIAAVRTAYAVLAPAQQR